MTLRKAVRPRITMTCIRIQSGRDTKQIRQDYYYDFIIIVLHSCHFALLPIPIIYIHHRKNSF